MRNTSETKMNWTGVGHPNSSTIHLKSAWTPSAASIRERNAATERIKRFVVLRWPGVKPVAVWKIQHRTARMSKRIVY